MSQPSTQAVRVLLVDDDPDDFLLTSDYLGEIQAWRFDIEWAKNFAEAREKIECRCHDIYFFDFLLGARTGLELLEEAVTLRTEAPIVLLTGKGDQRIDQEAMRLGAADYLVKDEIDAEKLERCIRYALDRAANLKALRESESKYRNIFEQSRDMIYISRPDGMFTYLNSSASDLTGYSLDELFALNGRQLYEKDESRLTFEQAMETRGEIRDFEFTLVTKSGEKRICLVSASVQEDSSGRYYQGVVHDITNRKRAERDLLMAEKLAATGRLVRTLAHEVRNPLTNINLAAEQLESETGENEEFSLYLGIIRRNSQRINDLISELLNSSKPAEMRFQPMPVRDALEAALRLAQDRMALKNIRLVRQYAWECQLQLDHAQIQIAFLNIIMNAIEAMEENRGVLTVGTNVDTDGRCLITIADNGTGIPREHLSRLFEPYFTSKNNGIGLGLAATLNIIQSHKATVEVESEEGVGTTFLISFPVE
jgi:PAS domain S-box-containing protein